MYQSGEGLTLAGQTGNQDIARRYAAAFFSLAQEQGQLDKVSADLKIVRSLLDESGDFSHFVTNNTLRRADQIVSVVAIAKHLKLSELTEKFLGVVAEKRRLLALGAIIAAVQDMISDFKGEVVAHVTAAQALDQAQMDEIAASLKKVLGKDVQVQLHVDADIMGGLIVRVGSRLIDSSVRTKLDRLHRTLKNNSDLSDKAKMREVA
ncbi:MAG: F0F1 ATP synthase subunit delta [Alphaproteobacteria bacterium]|nr:F0F1 ATP synthase subunit delta [Alphaproteobacteria bacterium]